MQTVASLGADELARALADGLLEIRTGPFTTRIRTGDSRVRSALMRLYAGHPARLDSPFSDFHVEVRRVGGLRRWIRPQINFLLDGVQPFKPLPERQSFAVFEWGLNWCLASAAHRWLFVHAAVLARGSDAVVLPAPPGSGKSTLCAALAFRGWRLLSDELVVLDPETRQVWPLARPINVKNESIAVVQRFLPEAVMTEPVLDTLKGTVAHVAPPAAAVSAMGEPARARWVVFPKWERGTAVSLQPLSRGEVFEALVENAFNYEVQGEVGFDALTSIANEAQGFSFRYSELTDAVAAFDRLGAVTS
jgi:HprK-related kinase A